MTLVVHRTAVPVPALHDTVDPLTVSTHDASVGTRVAVPVPLAVQWTIGTDWAQMVVVHLTAVPVDGQLTDGPRTTGTEQPGVDCGVLVAVPVHGPFWALAMQPAGKQSHDTGVRVP